MDRLEAMALLLRVAEKGSLSAAGRQLHMPLATVSRKLSELEAHLGTRLLTRTTRKLALTDAGVAYVAAARRILDDVDQAERAAAGEYQAPRGELVLTAPVLFGRLHLLPVVCDFLAAFPEIDIRLLLSDRNLHLIDDHVDMAARIGVLPDSTLVATRVGSMRTVVCASPSWLAAHGAPNTPEGLSDQPCVAFDVSPAAAIWRFAAADGKKAVDVQISPRLSVTTAEAAVAAAIRGVGATRVLQYQCAQAVDDGLLELVLENAEPEPLPVQLVHGARGRLPLKMRAFLDFASPRLRADLSRLARNSR